MSSANIAIQDLLGANKELSAECIASALLGSTSTESIRKVKGAVLLWCKDNGLIKIAYPSQ